jgi:hypothetical protein
MSVTKIIALVALVLVPAAAAIAVVLPLHYPVEDSTYRDLPTIAPIAAGIIAGSGCGLVCYSHFSQARRRSRAIEISIWISLGTAFVAWYAAMFVILNLKGS